MRLKVMSPTHRPTPRTRVDLLATDGRTLSAGRAGTTTFPSPAPASPPPAALAAHCSLRAVSKLPAPPAPEEPAGDVPTLRFVPQPDPELSVMPKWVVRSPQLRFRIVLMPLVVAIVIGVVVLGVVVVAVAAQFWWLILLVAVGFGAVKYVRYQQARNASYGTPPMFPPGS